jgi:hypothetical protein
MYLFPVPDTRVGGFRIGYVTQYRGQIQQPSTEDQQLDVATVLIKPISQMQILRFKLEK